MIHQKTLLALLTAPIAMQPTEVPPLLLQLDNQDLARLYVDVNFLRTCLEFLREQLWLERRRNSSITFTKFLEPLLLEELEPLRFLHGFLHTSLQYNPKQLMKTVGEIQSMTFQAVKLRPIKAQKEFMITALRMISAIFEFENQMQLSKVLAGETMGLSLYRTFDSLDAVFELDYREDAGMKTNLDVTQRLYEGAGAGVQSGYSTIMTALRYLNPARGASVVDLGSGYGRLGFVLGLMRPDIRFQGFEYVSHRTEVAKKIATKFEMAERVQFHTQDLVAEDFTIPAADIYYLYDPFSKESYELVLSRLVEVSRRQPIAIVTKGNARSRVLEIAERESWPAQQEFDGGNLCLFRSA